MSIRKIPFIQNEFYHIYNRGNSKQKIFNGNFDHEYFLKLLYLCNSDKSITMREIKKNSYEFKRGKLLVHIGAYCLMPNHFHILLTPVAENGVTKFMQKLSTAYSMYFNKKNKRTGSLFEGKFKSEHVNNDVYLKYLFSYIHLNPVKLIQKDWKENGIKNKKQALDFLQKYKWSSYLDYLEINRQPKVILNQSSFPKYFSSLKDFKEEIMSWINHNPNPQNKPKKTL